jgi:hypothetical protein
MRPLSDSLLTHDLCDIRGLHQRVPGFRADRPGAPVRADLVRSMTWSHRRNRDRRRLLRRPAAEAAGVRRHRIRPGMAKRPRTSVAPVPV